MAITHYRDSVRRHCPQVGNDVAPVHIHTFWRSGKTYFFNKVRACDKTVAFYEPFHHFHDILTPSIIALLDDQSWPSHHPRLMYPYFSEYLPLLHVDKPGVQGYCLSFSERNYFCNHSALDEQKKYICSLINYAENFGLRPALTYGRSMGRLPWLLQNIPGRHIALQRSIRGLWQSSQVQWTMHNDPDYLLNPLETMIISSMDLWIQEYFGELGLLHLRALASTTGNVRNATMSFLKNSDILVMQAFCGVFALGYALAEACVELIIDLEAVADREYRENIEYILREHYRLPINLEDCQVPIYHGSDNFEKVEAYYAFCIAISRKYVRKNCGNYVGRY